MSNQIWLGIFHFRKVHKVKVPGKKEAYKTISEELTRKEFILGNEEGKTKDMLYIGRALATRGIDRTSKTAWDKWTADDVRISCTMVRRIKSLSDGKDTD